MDMMRKKPELLSPAGDMEKLKMAVAYGADAVYLAGTSFGMRSFAGNFSPEELPCAVAYAHDHGVRVHVTVNTMPRSGEVDALPAHLERLNDAGVDALILADLGAFTLAGKYAPRCERHISTQQSIANYACAQAWYDLGAKRVVLARELSMDEIREIHLPGAGAGDLLPRGHVCVLLRPLPALQLHDRPGFQPGRLRPALPLPVRTDGGEAARRILPGF